MPQVIYWPIMRPLTGEAVANKPSLLYETNNIFPSTFAALLAATALLLSMRTMEIGRLLPPIRILWLLR